MGLDVGIGGIDIGPGGINVGGTVGGVPINIGIPIGGGGGGSEPPRGDAIVPGTLVADTGAGPCPGLFSVRGPDGTCINIGDAAPGGDPFLTGQVDTFGPAVMGRFGVGLVPAVEVQTVRRCPPGMALGKDGVCYEGLHRNSPKRKWPMGMKPLLTAGDRAAIRKASSAAGKLARSKKSLKKAARALEKVC